MVLRLFCNTMNKFRLNNDWTFPRKKILLLLSPCIFHVLHPFRIFSNLFECTIVNHKKKPDWCRSTESIPQQSVFVAVIYISKIRKHHKSIHQRSLISRQTIKTGLIFRLRSTMPFFAMGIRLPQRTGLSQLKAKELNGNSNNHKEIKNKNNSFKIFCCHQWGGSLSVLLFAPHTFCLIDFDNVD